MVQGRRPPIAPMVALREEMDLRTQSMSSTESGPNRHLIDGADLRCILSNLSQELCRPLESLRVGFDLLLVDSPNGDKPDRRGHVETMSGLCDDMLNLTKCYLDYAGLRHGTRALNLGTFTIGALVAEVDREFSARASESNIGWECFVEGEDSVVTTDASLCQQIFGKLVSNALKYSGQEGNIRVVGCLQGNFWRITVADDGPGIPPDDLGRVFEPFYRLPRDESSGVPGNGLGLAVCRELVEMLRGSIEFQSPCAKGTQVIVRFPVELSASSSGRDSSGTGAIRT